MYTIVNSILFTGLPGDDDGRIVSLDTPDELGRSAGVSLLLPARARSAALYRRFSWESNLSPGSRSCPWWRCWPGWRSSPAWYPRTERRGSTQ